MALSASVIIPVYNDAKNLERCLTRLFAAKTVDFEVIVVDDASYDDSAKVAQKFPCQLISLASNRGQAYARNRAVEKSRGELLLFTDADCVVMDDWVRQSIQKFEALLRQFPQLGAVSGRIDAPPDYVSQAYSYTSYAYAQKGRSCLRNYLNTANALVLKSAFDRVGGFLEDMCVNEDPELALKLAEAGYSVFFEPSLFVYHEHGIHRLGEFLAKERRWGRQSASKMDIRHKRLGVLLPLLQNPFTHFLLILPLAFFSTAKVVKTNGLATLFYLPFIFLGKLFFRWGNFEALFI